MPEEIKPVMKTRRWRAWFLFFAVAGGGILLGLLFVLAVFPQTFAENARRLHTDTPFQDMIGLEIVGMVLVVFGALTYLTTIATNCFTFSFRHPVVQRIRPKLFVAKVGVAVLVQGGAASMLTAPVKVLLTLAHVSPQMAFWLPWIGFFVSLNVVFTWLIIWAPLGSRLVIRRLKVRGIAPVQLASGLCVGISDPAKSSVKKIGILADDIGMLWITPEVLAYRGDSDHFDVRPQDLVAMERSQDLWNTSALSGTTHLIVRFRQPDGRERAVRFHTGGWTLTAIARSMDQLAEVITRWKESHVQPTEASLCESAE